jgi:hypothetical protein
MARMLFLALLGLVAALPARGADEPANKATGPNKIERGLDTAGKAIGKVADKAADGIKKGVDAAARAVETAGNKTGKWIEEKIK